MDDAYAKWLTDLKAGDEVAVSRSHQRGWDIARVERRTPSGRIVVAGIKSHFDAQGWGMGKHDVWNGPRRVYPVTAEVRAAIQREADMRTLDSANRVVDKLTNEQLRAIAKAIRAALGVK